VCSTGWCLFANGFRGTWNICGRSTMARGEWWSSFERKLGERRRARSWNPFSYSRSCRPPSFAALGRNMGGRFRAVGESKAYGDSIAPAIHRLQSEELPHRTHILMIHL
jgi:hypothetical protein